jgi:DNA-binding CsgD family transcriptional regulator
MADTPSTSLRQTEPRRAGALVRCGAELVELSERFYGRVLFGALAFVGLSALAALMVLPLQAYPPNTPVAGAAVATGMLVATSPVVLWRHRAVYRALRDTPWLQYTTVLYAAALIVHPQFSGELWWPSCALLMALAIVTTLPRVLSYCLLVLLANFAGHLVAADLDETRAVEIIGLWIGYPLWVATIAILTDRFAVHLLVLNANREEQRTPPPPLRVPAQATESSGADDAGRGDAASDAGLAPAATSPPPHAPADDGPVNAASDAALRPPRRHRAHAPGDIASGGLTARQIQVAALLADGLHYSEVAACLSISERQVQRHVAEAVARLDINNVYELVAVVVAQGIVPSHGTAAAATDRGEAKNAVDPSLSTP